jgi:hypothetical protein
MRKLIGPLVIVALLVALWGIFAHGNPGGISDAKYAEFKQLAPPRLLYSCTRKPAREVLEQRTRDCATSGRAGCDEAVYEAGQAEAQTVVDFVGGQQSSNYETLLRDARENCAQNVGDMGDGEFKVLEAKKD